MKVSCFLVGNRVKEQVSYLGSLGIQLSASMAITASNRRILGAGALFCLAFFGLLAGTAGRGKSLGRAVQGTPSHGNYLGLRFAIADFDGDARPDLATVQVVHDSPTAARYSIHFHLSGGPESAIGITAPLGGLRIVPRDVNGDDFLDLIVTTAMDEHFVAVLLNDGQGNFTVAKAGSFPAVENETVVILSAPVRRVGEPMSLAPGRSSFGLEGAFGPGPPHQVAPSSILPAAAKIALFLTLRPNSGRSPPAGIFPT